jgi:hypothetical protein
VSFAYSDMDRLILERWTDVVGLLDAQRETQERIEEMIDVVGERVKRWGQTKGFDIETYPKDPEFQAWRPSWADKRRGTRLELALGGFCPIGYRKVDVKHPYLWLYTGDLENFKVKEPERIAFARSLREALGAAAKNWEAPGTDDASGPLGQYLNAISEDERARIVSSPDALFNFATEYLLKAFEIADVIDAELQKLAG